MSKKEIIPGASPRVISPYSSGHSPIFSPGRSPISNIITKSPATDRVRALTQQINSIEIERIKKKYKDLSDITTEHTLEMSLMIKNKCEEFESTFSQIIEKLNNQMISLLEKLVTISNCQQNSTTKLNEIIVENEKLKNENLDLQVLVSKNKQESEQLKSQLFDLQCKLSDQASLYNSQIKEINDKHQETITHQNDTMNSMKSELKLQDDKNKMMQNQLSEMEGLVTMLSDLSNQNNQLKISLQQKVTENKQISESKDELNQKFNISCQELSQARNNLKDKDNHINELNSFIDQNKNEISRLKSDLTERDYLIEQSRSQTEKLKSIITQNERLLSENKKNIDELHLNINQKEESLKAHQKEIQELHAIIQQKDKNLIENTSDINHLKQVIDQNEKSLKECKNNIDKLESVISDKDERYNEMTKKNQEELEHIKNQAKEEIESLIHSNELKIKDINTKCASDIQQCKDECNEKINKAKNEHAKELERVSSDYENQLNLLKSNHQNKIDEMNHLIQTNEYEYKTKLNELSKKYNDSLTDLKHEKDAMQNDLEAKLSRNEQQKLKLEDEIKQLNQLNNEQKNNIESLKSLHSEKMQKFENEADQISQDLQRLILNIKDTDTIGKIVETSSDFIYYEKRFKIEIRSLSNFFDDIINELISMILNFDKQIDLIHRYHNDSIRELEEFSRECLQETIQLRKESRSLLHDANIARSAAEILGSKVLADVIVAVSDYVRSTKNFKPTNRFVTNLKPRTIRCGQNLRVFAPESIQNIDIKQYI